MPETEQPAFVTHHWGDDAQSPCGRYVGSVYYGVKGHAYSTDWHQVDCPSCLTTRTVGIPTPTESEPTS